MRIRANLRVVADETGTHAPAAHRLQDAAEVLGSLGFEIMRVGRRAVSVEADDSRFAHVLGVDATDPRGVSQDLEPPEDRLVGLVDHIEAMPPPELFTQ